MNEQAMEENSYVDAFLADPCGQLFNDDQE